MTRVLSVLLKEHFCSCSFLTLWHPSLSPSAWSFLFKRQVRCIEQLDCAVSLCTSGYLIQLGHTQVSFSSGMELEVLWYPFWLPECASLG